jgi:hypothetical protein
MYMRMETTMQPRNKVAIGHGESQQRQQNVLKYLQAKRGRIKQRRGYQHHCNIRRRFKPAKSAR